ncbi:MAG: ribonuclease R [Gammaproteobacteria bacterium]
MVKKTKNKHKAPEKHKRKKAAAIKDPYARREAQRYDNPIPSREYILQTLEQQAQPMSFQQLSRTLLLDKEAESQEALQRRLRAMLRDVQVVQNRSGHYCLIDKLHLIAGTIEGHAEGFGFVIPHDGSNDLYLSPRQMRGVIHGDEVLVYEMSTKRRGRREAVIVEIVNRSPEPLVGCLHKQHGVVLFAADNKRITHDIIIPDVEYARQLIGQVVTVELISELKPGVPLVGKVIEILGDPMAPGMEIDIAIREHNLPHQWSSGTQKAIAKLPKTVRPRDCLERLDLRSLPFVTIDGEDAKDFDDAVYCEPKARGGWKLYVAIADVSYYVKANSALDEDAKERGNSVYFPGKVIPMLPEALSNNLCSLMPNVDRLAMVCEMHISEDGKLTRSQFHEAVIHSHARLTYTQVAEMLLQPNLVPSYYQALYPHVVDLHLLYKLLQKQRAQRGAIEFESIETRIVFDDERKIKRIVPVQRNEAHRIIEECMLLANVATARYLQRHKIPTLYRVHEPPPSDKLTEVHEFLAELGLRLGGRQTPQALDYARLMRRVKQRPDAQLIQLVLLRSLSQAVYQPNNKGHFGLAYKAYLHFTSPIRRYPDLLVHRAIRHLLRTGTRDDFEYSKDEMLQLGEHCSFTERRADEATRDAVDWLKCEYMRAHVGKQFSGRISAVTHFGVFVTLNEVYVEGLVHVTALKNDYYQFDAVHHCLRGNRTGTIYRLGEPIDVLVAQVNLEDKKIDFVLVSQD